MKSPRGVPGLGKTASQQPKVPQLKGLAIEERASEEVVEHAEVELEFDTALPKSARMNKGMMRAGTLEEHHKSGPEDLSAISIIFLFRTESRRAMSKKIQNTFLEA